MRVTRLVAHMGMVAVLAVSAAACGSDDDGTGDSPSPPETDGPPATGEPDGTTEVAAETTAEVTDGDPIKIMTITPMDNEILNIPEAAIGAQAGVDRINSEGGVNGRPLELIVCNDLNDPNEAASCARRAVDENVVAVVGSFSLAGGSRVIPVLEEAGIAYVGNASLSPEDLTSKIAFPLNGSVAANWIGVGKVLAGEAAGEVQAARMDIDAAAGAADLIGLGLTTEGKELKNVILVPIGAPDLASYAQNALSNGTGVGVVLEENTAMLFYQAMIDLGVDFQNFKAAGVASNSGPILIETFGEQVNGVSFVSPFPSDDEPEVARAIADLQAQQSDVKIDEMGLTAYFSVIVAANILDGLDTVDAESFLAGMANIDGMDLGFFEFSTIEERTVPGFERLFNGQVYVFEIQDGKAVQVAGPIDVLE